MTMTRSFSSMMAANRHRILQLRNPAVVASSSQAFRWKSTRPRPVSEFPPWVPPPRPPQSSSQSSRPLPSRQPTAWAPPPSSGATSWPGSATPQQQATQQQPPQQAAAKTNLTLMQIGPYKYQPKQCNSLVYLPNTVSLQYENDKDFTLNCVDFGVAKAGDKGKGHVLLGRNGCGKSLLVKYLANPKLLEERLLDSDITDHVVLPNPKQIAHVSFDSHLQMIGQNAHLSVQDAITGGKRGTLTKTMQYLIVRFGLKSLLHRTVSTLSTGEIRKTLLVAALSQQPRLLILENPYDGLDVESRKELQSIVAKTIEGLHNSGKLLVASVNAQNVPPAQVVLSTHRPEEIGNEIGTVSLIASKDESENDVFTIHRPPGWSQEQIMYAALGMDKDHNKNQNWAVVEPWNAEDPSLPSCEDLTNFWAQGKAADNDNDTVLMNLEQVKIQRQRDGVVKELQGDDLVTLLHPLSWKIEAGQRWLIAGGNGAGKSTLSRFLLSQEEEGVPQSQEESEHVHDTTVDFTSGTYTKTPSTTIGWVSTESHLGTIMMDDTSMAWDVITHQGRVSDDVARQVVSWVFGDEGGNIQKLLETRSLTTLSQGQQKLVLMAAALATRPKLLILDEPTQGLDWVHRRRILALLERLCQSTHVGLVYITHYPEEWIPSISHVLHLGAGQVKYQGPKRYYSPNRLEEEEDEDAFF